jgi:tRNA pseudouridine38-40 synthase
MQKYAARISYVGTGFCGWQKQTGSAAGGDPSIGALLEETLKGIVSERVSIIGSGRTDSGVHASGQVIHFILRERIWEPEILKRALNSRLPPVIRVLKVAAVPADFHAQRSALKKQYSYYFQQGASALPFCEPYSWWIHRRLDLGQMQRALDHLVGEKDFKVFQSRGAKPGPTVRRILEAQVEWVPLPMPLPGAWAAAVDGQDFGFARVRLVGTGFLKQMVRSIAGTLLQVGEGRRDPDSFAELLRTQERSEVGPTAPGRALWLEQVWYEHFS